MSSVLSGISIVIKSKVIINNDIMSIILPEGNRKYCFKI